MQFVTRLLFTFNLKVGLKKYGAIFGGIAITAITYFLLIKGLKGASFISSETRASIVEHTGIILAMMIIKKLYMPSFIITTRSFMIMSSNSCFTSFKSSNPSLNMLLRYLLLVFIFVSRL